MKRFVLVAHWAGFDKFTGGLVQREQEAAMDEEPEEVSSSSPPELDRCEQVL